MAEAKVLLTAEDHASSIIDQVTKRLGVFNKEGLAMGVTFALVNKGIQLAEQAFNDMIKYVQEGIKKNMEFEYSLAQLSVSVNNLDMSMGDLRDNIKDFGLTFGENINTITNALRSFIREGYNATESLTILYETEKLRTAYGDELSDTQNTVNTALEVFNLKATDAGYITRMLNMIMSNTGLSVSQIGDIMSKLAPNIQDANIGLSTFSDYLYTIEGQGSGPRQMISELADAFKDLGFQIENMPTDRIPSIEEKMKTMMGTKQFREQIETQYKEQMQTEQGGWFDLLWDPNKEYKKALESVQAGKTKYEPTGMAPYLDARKIQEYMNLIRGVTNVELEALQQTAAAARAKEEAEERLATAIKKTNDEIQSQSLQAAQLGNEIYKNEQLQKYTLAMHDATDAVQEQQDAIEQLDRISRRYNLEQQSNNLEIMKIQYGAGRRGLSRSQQNAIKAIEHENMGIQILEQENQIKIGNIQINGLQNALDEQEQIRRDYAQLTFTQDMMDLDINLTNQKTKYKTFFDDIAAMRREILGTNTTTVSSVMGSSTPASSNINLANIFSLGQSFYNRQRRGNVK